MANDPFAFLEKFGWRPGLERIGKLLEEWGNPQENMDVILVGGTNGKGSVAAMLSAILREEGHRVGSYYSPHLLDFGERMQVNGRNIGEGMLDLYVKRAKGWMDAGNEITYFEALTASAYDYFSANHVDWAVMEVGMGGGLDAVNAARERLSVISSISLEHREWLGDTEEKIAYEKAGIIKNGPCVSGSGNEAIRRRAREMGVPLYVYDEDFECEGREAGSERTAFDYVGKERIEGLELGMLGKFQVRNAGLAVRAAEELGIGEESIRKGLKKARLRGRMEVLRREPLVVADVAHNPGGASALVESLDIFGKRRRIVVFGCMKDKDWKGVLQILSRVADKFIFAKTDMGRAEEPEKLLEEGRKYCESEMAESVGEAMVMALGEAGDGDMVLITGSLYIMKEAYKELGAL
ncbi:MAG: bifunctional folylpolyglutamate synthase/dihydrofolate synthase [Candidatus ainarchaeum sp.]|nr:bifunctional folylpolyglutamate synthase/dihydrofolate synthase [Candidatus ainarchaeum sp.]MDD5095897.1 bifunctional folylpolyglutamate synthase/dihydrofolate synthase [Candidatus ainarchaeum sp.]